MKHKPFIDSKSETARHHKLIINALEDVTILFVYLTSQKNQLYELFVCKIPLHNYFSL